MTEFVQRHITVRSPFVLTHMNTHTRTLFLLLTISALSFVPALSQVKIQQSIQPNSSTIVTGPTTQPSMDDTDRLIAQLGSDTQQNRDDAQSLLIKLGESIKPQLTKAADTAEDPEIRSRAAIILALLRDSVTKNPSLITLHVRQMAPQEAFNQIGAQANAQLLGMGLAVPIPGRPVRTVTLDADQKPFWEVMTDVCTQLNVYPALGHNSVNSMRMVPAFANWMAQPTHQIVGPYWIGIESLSHLRTMDLTGGENLRDQFKVRLIVFPEPKLYMTHISDFVVKEAMDNAGHSMMPGVLPSNTPQAPLRHFDTLNHTIEFGLTYPDQQPGSRISILRGDFVALVAQDFMQYQADDVLDVAKIKNPLPNCNIQTQVTRQGNEFRVEIQFDRQRLTEDQRSALMNCAGDVTLEDAQGLQLSAIKPVTMYSVTDTVGKGYFKANATFSSIGFNTSLGSDAKKVGDPKRLRWNFPTLLKAIRVPVQFKDLPMP